MSLINDALKRVKEAQHKAPPTASLGPQLRPVEPVPAPARHALGWLLPIAIAGVALLTLLLVWELATKVNSPVSVRAQTEVQSLPTGDSSSGLTHSAEPAQPARSTLVQSPATPAASPSAPIVPAPAQNSPSNVAITNSVAVAQAKPAPVQQDLAKTNSNVVQSSETNGPSANTNTVIAQAQPPKPPPLKLQGIVFSQRPSAVINGKTVFVGDRLREFRVASITQDTAILVSAGHTNVLSLSE